MTDLIKINEVVNPDDPLTEVTLSKPMRIECRCGARMVVKAGTKVKMKPMAMPNIWRSELITCHDCRTLLWGEGPWYDIPGGTILHNDSGGKQ